MNDPVQRRVVFLLLPNVHLLDMAGPAQAFHSAVNYGAGYELRFCASSPEISDWLNAHFAEPVRLPRLAKLANMSSRNLVRAFKATTGLTPLQYQQRLRLEFAGSLLRDSRLTLESIAESCGFADARHFRRLWKSTFHASPSEVRKV